MKSRNKQKTLKHILGIVAGVGGGIVISKLIMNKVKLSDEIYSITVDFDE